MKSIKDKIKPPLEVEKGYVHSRARIIDISKVGYLYSNIIPRLPITLKERIRNEKY
jgi:hypothetical protein